MNLTRSQILSLLPVFQNLKVKQVSNQSVNDIIKAMKDCHNEYAHQYEKIAPYFVGSTVKQTAKNIFDFLKRETKYFQEPDSVQTVQSPAAIIANGLISGIDCKNYALFAGGILDAINRLGLQRIPWVYRYVSDKIFSTIPGHVFVVIYPDTNKEIWIDPIPQISTFNERWTYYYQIDKKPHNMALYKVSGMGAVSPELVATGVKAGTDAAKGLIQSIASKNGVSPSFFNTFGFLKFLDNSTAQWKSRSATMRNWTPAQRITWYIDRMNSGDNYHSAVQQYAELYGNSYDPNKGTPDDRGKVPAELAAMFNEFAEQLYFKGSNTIQDGPFVREKKNVLLDITKSPDYANYMDQIKMITDRPGTQKAGMNQVLGFGLLAGAILFFANRKKSN